MTSWPTAFFVAIALTVNTAVAEVVRVEIESREDVLDGRPFGPRSDTRSPVPSFSPGDTDFCRRRPQGSPGFL